LEAVAEIFQRLLPQFLLLVGDHLPLAGLTHAVALDGFGEDDGRLPLMVHGCVIRGIHLRGVVAAPRQSPDVIVAPVGDHGLELGILAEKVLADVGAVLRLEVLVFAVDAFLHALPQNAGDIAGEQSIPARAPDHLDHVPAGAAKDSFELLNDLAIAADRSIEPLQIAVDNEDQVVEHLPAGKRDRANALRLVHFSITAKHPDLTFLGIRKATAVQVLEEARLIDAHQRPKAHGDGRELPEVGHEPRMRVGREALAVNLLPEVEELLLAQPPLEKSAGVNAGRGVALIHDQVAAVVLAGGMPEVQEADIVERGC
jgi:hypothetical protein